MHTTMQKRRRRIGIDARRHFRFLEDVEEREQCVVVENDVDDLLLSYCISK